MVLQMNANPGIENFRHYPEEVVQKLRGILARGAQAYPDPRRKNFFDVENGSRMFFIHVAPTGRVWLLASWLKGSRAVQAVEHEFAAAHS